MAKNRYVKQHKDFCAWLDRERDTMPIDLLKAAEAFRRALWCAAKNPKPPSDLQQHMDAFARHRDLVNRMPDTHPPSGSGH